MDLLKLSMVQVQPVAIMLVTLTSLVLSSTGAAEEVLAETAMSPRKVDSFMLASDGVRGRSFVDGMDG